ncbi:MAG: glycosyltransferase [Verrucomicrobia bacterium]|nr:glycosyltransferase [Verrucomicrobiota bacterium]
MSISGITVVLPNYNHAQFLPEAIDSVLNQSCPPTRFIVVDDASTDGSLAVIDRYASHDKRINIVRHAVNQGVVRSTNDCLKSINTEYVMFVAADDKIMPDCLESSALLLDKHKEAAFASGLSHWMTEQGELSGLTDSRCVRQTPSFLPPSAARDEYNRSGSWFMGNTTMYRTQMLCGVGRFPEQLGPYADGFVSLVLALRHGACFQPRPLSAWRRLDGSFSAQTARSPEKLVHIGELAREKFTLEFPGLLSTRELRRWQRRWDYGLLLGQAQAGWPNETFSTRQVLGKYTLGIRTTLPILLGIFRHSQLLQKVLLGGALVPLDALRGAYRRTIRPDPPRLQRHC